MLCDSVFGDSVLKDGNLCPLLPFFADAPTISETEQEGEGSTRTLSALVAGNPPPDTRWLHNNQALTSEGDISISSQEQESGRRVSLTVSNLSPEDRGNYTLVANNSAGTNGYSWLIPVECK